MIPPAGKRHGEATESRRRSSTVSAALYTEVTLVLSTIHSCCLKKPYPGEELHYLVLPDRATTACG